MKKCSKCHKLKKTKLFSKRRVSPDGLDGWCKTCKSRATKKWVKNNKTRIRETGKKWRLNNRDKVIQNKRRWRKRNPEKAREIVRNSLKKNGHKYKHLKWKRWIQTHYGVTQEQFDARLAKQGGVCAICKKIQACGKRKVLYVDHCHRTEVFRGLLCFKCNVMLGAANDNTSTLIEAIKYLKAA